MLHQQPDACRGVQGTNHGAPAWRAGQVRAHQLSNMEQEMAAMGYYLHSNRFTAVLDTATGATPRARLDALALTRTKAATATKAIRSPT